MIEYLQLAGAITCSSLLHIIGAFYNRKTQGKRNTNAVYNMVYGIAVFLGWSVLFIVDFSFDAGVLPYSLAFAAFYALANVGLISALKTGSALLTSLLCHLSLIAVSIWGFFFWGEPFTTLIAIGLTLVVIAVFLCLYTGGKKDAEAKTKFSWKWVIYVSMAFFGNAGCTIVQRQQQRAFAYQHGNMLMFFATLCSALVFVAMWLKTDKRDTVELIKTKGYMPTVSGIANALMNVFVILLASASLSASLVFPAMSVGALALTTLFSVLALKERLRWWQWLGIVLGAVAIVTLSI
jgi:drug/metabolite transporter (DMT)-like permease